MKLHTNSVISNPSLSRTFPLVPRRFELTHCNNVFILSLFLQEFVGSMTPPPEREDFEKDLEQCRESHKKAVSQLYQLQPVYYFAQLLVDMIFLKHFSELFGTESSVKIILKLIFLTINYCQSIKLCCGSNFSLVKNFQI